MPSTIDQAQGPSGLGIDFFPGVCSVNPLAQLVNSAPQAAPGPQNTPQRGNPYVQAPSLEKCAGETSRNPSKELHRQSTVDLDPDWKGSEIGTVLGNDKSRLKSGARLLPQTPGEPKGVALEKAKRRSRVDVDIFLKNDICVEGGYLQGLVKILIRKGSKRSQAILLSGGKIRVVGFESLAKDEERFVFYQSCADLSDITSGLDAVYSSGPDEDGFVKANEGIHVLPFTLKLTASQDQGKPKGPMHTASGISVRYIAMVSIRIKDATSGKLSISHFYRDCSVWPRLNPSAVLSPASRPIQVTVSDGLVMGGNGKVTLTASLHRLHWVSGQLCHVRFEVTNNSKKCLKLLTLELFQTITTFKPKRSKYEHDHPPEDHHTATATTKQIAQSTLTVGQGGTRGHASASGWWAGVAPGSSQTFSHSIQFPADSLSIPRGKLIEVCHNLKATISPGTFLSTDVHVSIPIEIISFLSIDPPPPPIDVPAKPLATSNQAKNIDKEENTIIEDSEQSDEDDYTDDDSDDGIDELGNLSVHDDTDEVVQHAVSSVRIDDENAPRFADLYYSSVQKTSEPLVGDSAQEHPDFIRNRNKDLPNIQPEEPKKLTSFAARVEEKIARRRNTLVEAIIVDDRTSAPRKYEASKSANSSPREAIFLASNMPTGNTRNNIESLANVVVASASTRTQTRILHVPLKDPGQTQTAASHERSKSNPVTPNRHPSVDMLTSSATRPKSVRDKIRELEELAAGACSDI